ncbi:MAG TPA: hypothetical protein VGL71_00485 [Urbifossiella sp.]
MTAAREYNAGNLSGVFDAPIPGTYRDGKVILDAPANWEEGAAVLVAPSLPSNIRMLSEVEQGDTDEEIAHWIADFAAIPPLTLSLDEETSMLEWRRRMKEFNRQAVRHEMEGQP